MNLGKKKIKIEMEDEEGGKYNLSLEGSISKTKMLKLYEFMSMMDGTKRITTGTAMEKLILIPVQMAGWMKIARFR